MADDGSATVRMAVEFDELPREGGIGLFCRGTADCTQAYTGLITGSSRFTITEVTGNDTEILCEDVLFTPTFDDEPTVLEVGCAGRGGDERSEVGLAADVGPTVTLSLPRGLGGPDTTEFGLYALRFYGEPTMTVRFTLFAFSVGGDAGPAPARHPGRP